MGLYGIGKVIAKTGRNSIIVIILGVIIGLATIMIPTINGIDLSAAAAQGVDITAFHNPC